MKKFLTILAVLMVTSTVLAVDLWVTWKPGNTNEFVTSFVVEQAKAPSTNFVPVVTFSGTTNTGVIRGLTPGDYSFRLIAKNSVGSSPPSNVISYPTNAPSSPVEFKFTVPK
jgi:hypothetical protein